MSMQGPVWVGADPGGKGAFGVAVLFHDGNVETATVDCADDAMRFLRSIVHSVPGGVGVDAPLWWSSDKSSDRLADQWLRKEYGLSGGAVQTANSLKGAALVQGAMFVSRIRDWFAAVPVTECHPKAVLKVEFGDSWTVFVRQHSLRAERDNEHERDAIIAAVAAREGFERRWRLDLSVRRHNSEQDPKAYWLAPVHYFWPHRQ